MRRQSLKLRWPALLLGLTLLCVALPATSAVATQPRITVAGVAPIPAQDTIVKKTITTSFDVTLAPRNASGLSSFIASLSDTASANFHRYLTSRAFAQRFGATASSVDAVSSYLRGYGLRVGSLSTGRLVLHVTGTTTNIAHAFSARVETVRRADGVLAAQLATKGTLPGALAHDIAGVAGLSSIVQPSTNLVHSHVSSHATVPMTCASDGGETSTTPNSLGGYTAPQEAQLYGVSAEWANGNVGTGQTIALYELSAYDPSDLATFLQCYGLSPSVTPISVDGGPTGSYDDEPTLDIEQAAALAPGANFEVYQGPNNSTGPIDTYTQIADDDTATIISTSWGTCESDPSGDPSAEQPIFEQMSAEGQTIVSAAGDSGSSDCNGITNNNLAVDDPASQPSVTGVGGLTVNDINPLNQTVWDNPVKSGEAGAGGGGVSVLWSRPTWQVAPGISASDTMRLVPDLSALADPGTGFIQYFTGTAAGTCIHECNAGWDAIGGTSVGAPLVSALVAVSAQACDVPRLGNINPSLYAMASTGFVDVTTGSNDLYNVGGYSAGPGYDEASGLGSPDGAAFFAGLCPPKFDLTESSFTTSKTTAPVDGAPINVTATLHDTNNNAIANALVNVTATSTGAGSVGRVTIDNDRSSETTSGHASYVVTSDSNGAATFSVSTTEPGQVVITVNYESQLIYTTTLQFTTAAKVVPTAPGRATIAALTPLVGGFQLNVRAPTSSGGSAITSYQYSVSGGSKWLGLAKRATSIKVSNLAKGKSYKVTVRALNAYGPGAASPVKSVVTRK
jgi:subtilase family serine protease